MNLDKLAIMVAKGFNDITGKMATKKDLAKIEQDLTQIDGRLDVVEAKLDKALYTSVTQLEVRVKRLEQKWESNKIQKNGLGRFFNL